MIPNFARGMNIIIIIMNGSSAQFRPSPPLTRFRNKNLFYGTGLLVQRPTPNLEDQVSVFMTPGDRVTQLYPQALGTHFSPLLRHVGLQWDYSLIQASTREGMNICLRFFLSLV
jgi:hypothetical protein